MKTPVITLFNNKGGVGRTSLVYHLAWMFSELGERVLACDLDPQANLTASFIEELALEDIWNEGVENRTIHQCISPLMKVGDIREPEVHPCSETLGLLVGDVNLSLFEESLSDEWSRALGESPFRSFRILTAFWHVMQMAARSFRATMILVDAGPNLGSLNRSALIATDHVISPLAADLFSLKGLDNLGPALAGWRRGWEERCLKWKSTELDLPDGRMQPAGYVIQQHSMRWIAGFRPMIRGAAAFPKPTPGPCWTRRVPIPTSRTGTITAWLPSGTTGAWFRWRRRPASPYST